MGTQYKAEFKAKIALLAIKEEMTIAEIAKTHNVPPRVISQWKRDALDAVEQGFAKSQKFARERAQTEEKIATLERKVGQLTLDNDFLKKNCARYDLK